MYTFLELGRVGALGNQMFQVAALMGASRRHRTNFAIPPWTASRWMAGCPFPAVQREDGWEVYEEPAFHFQPIPPPASDGTSLFGYFQSWRYFDHCLDEVRARLGASFESKVQAHLKLPGYQEGENSASIHIRRGDYLPNGNYFQLEETQYYRRAMQEAGGSRTNWYIFSDDPDWCLRHFTQANMTVVAPGRYPYLDLIAMSRCRCNIIGNSSFSWWAAMLNQNPHARVYCPEPSCWFRGSLAHQDTSDLLPPNWIRVGID